MAKNNGANQDFTNNADGFDITGGVTRRKLTLSGADVSVVGSGTATMTYPSNATTLAGLSLAQTWTATQTFGTGISLVGTNITTDTTTGTMIGTGTAQKIGFFGSTPVIQQVATQEIGTALSNLGLRASGGSYLINTSGQVTMTGLTSFGSGGFYSPPTTRTGTSTTLTTTSGHINLMNPTAAATVTLPQTANNGQRFYFKNISAFTVTISVATSGTIDGASTFVIAASGNKVVEVWYSGTSGVWYIYFNN